MKTISMQGDDGRYIGLLLGNLKEKDIVGKGQLDRLQPYISSFIDSEPSLETARGKLKVTVLSDTQAAFSIDGADESVALELLSKISAVCKENLTERLIVPQYMGDGPTIGHRVMQFEVDKSQMFVKYCTLGDFNNFDVAMKEVAEMYPGVRV
jgi:hypothetical protein